MGEEVKGLLTSEGQRAGPGAFGINELGSSGKGNGKQVSHGLKHLWE